MGVWMMIEVDHKSNQKVGSFGSFQDRQCTILLLFLQCLLRQGYTSDSPLIDALMRSVDITDKRNFMDDDDDESREWLFWNDADILRDADMLKEMQYWNLLLDRDRSDVCEALEVFSRSSYPATYTSAAAGLKELLELTVHCDTYIELSTCVKMKPLCDLLVAEFESVRQSVTEGLYSFCYGTFVFFLCLVLQSVDRQTRIYIN